MFEILIRFIFFSYRSLMPNIYSFLLFGLLHLVLTLHSQTHHQTSTTNPDDQYAKGLQVRMQQLKQALANSKLQIDNFSTKVKADGAIPTQQSSAFQTALNDEKTALSNLDSYLNLPLNTKPCNSSQLAIQQKASLRLQSDSVNSSLQTLKKELTSCAKCIITDPLSQSLVRQQNYLYVTNQITESSCTIVPKTLGDQTASSLVDLSKSNFKNNLNAKNWVFGTTNEDQYKMEMFASSIKYNLVDCPIEKPYVHSLTKDCFNCPEGMTYNLGSKACDGCPVGSLFSLITNNCECGANLKYNPSTKKCEPVVDNTSLSTSICPKDKPIWNSVNKLCEACPLATPVFDATQSKCVACPDQTTWNAQTNTCTPNCPVNNTYSVQLKKCVPQVQCDATKPVLNTATQTCEPCPVNTKWNADTKKCDAVIVCPQGSVLNPKTGQCEKAEPQKCDDIRPIWNTTTLTCQICPQQTPVWNKQLKKCEPCPPATPVYDYALFKCMQKICDAGFKWNKDKLKCSPQSQPCGKEQIYNFSGEVCINKCEANHTYFPANDSCSCLPQKPFFNSTTRLCTQPPCENGTKWNPKLLKCIPLDKKCETWQTYDFNTAECINKCEPNIVYVKANDSCVCPPQKPVLNQTTRKCEQPQCQNGTLWNVNLLKCSPVDKKCQAWQIYNFTNETCINKCEVNHTYIKQTDGCTCTTDYPVFDPKTRTCKEPTCEGQALWNKFLMKCSPVTKVCEKWEKYNFNTQSCESKCQVNQTYLQKNDTCTCPAERPNYNSTTKKCTQPLCPNDTKWNNDLIKCSPVTKACAKWESYDFKTQTCIQKCQENQTYFAENGTCTCPPIRPVYNNLTKQCNQPVCPNDNKWNPNLLKCSLVTKKCDVWQIYNFTDEKCYDKCEANHTYFKENDTCSCTPQIPQFDPKTRKCVEPNCENGTKWNQNLKKCSPLDKKCQPSQTYQFSTEKCIEKCQANITYDKATDMCNCPAQKPVFNATSRKCQQPPCPEGFKWNSQLVKCSPKDLNCTKWQNANFSAQECVNKCEVNQTYFAQNNTCSCPPERPFYDKQTLLACVQPKCENGSKWNKYKLKCSPETKKCQIWQEYNFTLEECVNQCQINHTFFKENDTCSCTPDAPLFQPKTRKCIIPPCAQGSQWNKNLKKCSPLTKQCLDWQLYNFTTELCDKKCDVNRSYFKQSDTCQCQPQFPIFNKTTRSCVEPKCQGQALWNKFLLKCSPVKQTCEKWQYYDFTTETCLTKCQVNHTYFAQNDTCSCLPQKPVFNKTSRLCQQPVCQNGTKWNVNLLKCSPLEKKCQSWQEYIFVNESCLNKCQPNQTYFKVNDTCSCVPLTPEFDKVIRKCVEPKCPDGQIWNKTLIKCSPPWAPPPCPLNMVFDMKTSVCVCKEGFQYYQVYKSCKPICKMGQFLNTLTMLCEPIKTVAVTCGKNMYLSTSGKCQCLSGYVLRRDGVNCRFNCTTGFKYNTATNSCELIICQAGSSYNSNTRKCEAITCPVGAFYNQAKNQCQACPSGYTYNTGTKLCELAVNTLCPQGYLFNSATKLCDLIPTNCTAGQYYNNATKTCMDLYITSPQAANIITTGMTSYTSTYVQAKAANPKLQDCVTPTPFYDKNTKSCVQCSGSQPYFNLQLNKCQDCGSATYNSTTFSCAANAAARYNFDPTIGRFVMNIF